MKPCYGSSGAGSMRNQIVNEVEFIEIKNIVSGSKIYVTNAC